MARTLSTPGFWDLHLHGVRGVDFMHADEDALVFACEQLGRNGTAAFSPTLLTAEPTLLRDACGRIGLFLEKCARPRFLPRSAARPLGLHLEGPFLNPAMAGAHPRSDLRRPSRAAAEKLIAAARGHVAIVTLAPELPGALALVRWLASRRVRVQLGHTLATSTESNRAVRAGATGLTHLYNAMRIHHRSPGVLSSLSRGHLTAELITDGIHLDAGFVAWLASALPGRLYAVSDGCSAIGATARTPLTLGSLVLKREGRAAVVAKSGTLAGGATFLSSHPGLLRRHFEDTRFLELFYRLQRGLFPREARAVRHRNHFDARSLRFLACEHH